MSEAQDFLVELGVEELPPKSLLKLKNAFESSVKSQLSALGLGFSGVLSFATPRRLAVVVSDLQTSQPDRKVETLGPAVKAAFDDSGNPTKAALGFAKKLGVEVANLEQAETDKGARLAYYHVETGIQTKDYLETLVTKALDSLPIAKRMRWGASRNEFVRPVHWLVMIYGNDVPDANILGLTAGKATKGHRFHANQTIEVSEPSLYSQTLQEKGRVIADYDVRRQMVRSQVLEAAEKLNATAIIDDGLLDEVTALVEWPVALAGNFEERFLDVPSEALISSMAEHQKYFHLVNNDGQLLPHFITISNIESLDPSRVIDGNERVIRPRLADAAFFYETDLKTPFADFRERLKPIVFQAKLGTVFDKTERVAQLAADIAPMVGADPTSSQRAGELCKCDLVTDMVGEFSDLQGIMGRYYAAASNEPEDVSATMFEHYLPRFAGDALPSTPTSTAVALADRLDTLTGIFGIGQLPTGSKDPFALRRASLGVLRILVEGEHEASLQQLLTTAHNLHGSLPKAADESVKVLMEYMLDRFSAWFSDLGIPAESFIAVRAIGIDDPFDIYNRTLAVTEFSKTPPAPALAAANKRVSNILAKGEGGSTEIDASLFNEDGESTLYAALCDAESAVGPMMKAKDYSGALAQLALLRDPIDQFFDQVMVMTEDQAQRENRLALLRMLRALFLSIADISLLPNES